MNCRDTCYIGPNGHLINNPAKKYFEAASKHNFIAHYTSTHVLRQILKSRYIKLNRLNNLNDLEECENAMINDKPVSVFTACFTHNENESVPQWNMYTIGRDGVLIRYWFNQPIGDHAKNFVDPTRPVQMIRYDKSSMIPNEKSKIIKVASSSIRNGSTDFSGYNITIAQDITSVLNINLVDIDYNTADHKFLVDTRIATFRDQYGLNHGIMENTIGVSKDQGWSHEQETRIIGCLSRVDHTEQEIDMFEYILFPFSLANVRKIEIIQSPWISEEGKEEIEEICRDCLQQNDPPCVILPSCYFRKLKPR
ncbi:MAG: hypothetical protein VB104_07430 [Candidatus Limiplasma sp.]|nr:hypothetical protein [Candidatus Limiplasma sp.]